MGTEKFYLYAKANADKYRNLDAFEGAKIGVEPKKISANLAREWARDHNIQPEFVEFSNVFTLRQALDNGDIDLLINTDAEENYGYRNPRRHADRPYHGIPGSSTGQARP